MKVQGGNSQATGGIAQDPELEALNRELLAAIAGLGQAVNVAVSAPLSLHHHGDHYSLHHKVGVEPAASSVTPRDRGGEGVPLHQILASRGFLGSVASADDQLFAWDSHADTSLDEISTRKLLGYYDSSMEALHSSLGRMDFDRKEGLWYERYREDLWRDIDSDGDYYRRQSDYSDRQFYDSYEADRMAAEMALSSQSYYDNNDRYR